MPETVFSILGALILIGGHGDSHQIAEASGYEIGSYMRFSGTMKRLGWIERRAGLIHITERGKIAHAIEVGRRTKIRGQRRYKAQPPSVFDRLHAKWHQGIAA